MSGIPYGHMQPNKTKTNNKTKHKTNKQQQTHVWHSLWAYTTKQNKNKKNKQKKQNTKQNNKTTKTQNT